MKHILEISPLETIDGLIIISDDEDIWRFPLGDCFDDAILCIVGILVFIEHDELIPLSIGSPEIDIFSEYPLHITDHIREIIHPPFLTPYLISSEDISEFFEFFDVFFSVQFSLFVFFQFRINLGEGFLMEFLLPSDMLEEIFRTDSLLFEFGDAIANSREVIVRVIIRHEDFVVSRIEQ